MPIAARSVLASATPTSAHEAAPTSWSAPSVLTDLKAHGDGVYKGHAYDPKHNIHALRHDPPARPERDDGHGLRDRGIFCKEQRWTARQLSATALGRSNLARQNRRLKRAHLVGPIAVGREVRRMRAHRRMDHPAASAKS